jgi:phage terminase large subunit-like protein
MPSLTKVSGGSQPVFATDTLNGPQLAATAAYTPAGTPTNFMGPKLDFFGMDLGADPSTEADVNGMLVTLLQTIQQTATVAIYQVAATANVTNFSVATYPTGAFNTATNGTDNSAATLQGIIQGLGTVSGYDLANATVTNVGFRLASTATSAS